MKKMYFEVAEMELVRFAADVITTSTEVYTDENDETNNNSITEDSFI
jgi:hypothetical protein